ncbi:MAG: ribonuclease HII [Zestosphaera sp.]
MNPTETLILGIDEAGRGPVIGDMFVACVGFNEGGEGSLIGLGVKDSKRLKPRARSALFPRIVEVARVVFVRRYSPGQIDAANVNDLFVNAVTSAVKSAFEAGFKVGRVYVDALSSPKHRLKIVEGLPSSVELVYEFGADRKYPIVAAASIIAKYLRDAHVRTLHEVYGDFGSGYPSDPRTIKWLSEHAVLEVPIVRRSWSTLARLGMKPVRKDQGLLKWLGSK